MGKIYKHSRRIGLDGITCYVCAPRENNPDGLNLEFLETDEGAETRFTLGGRFQSYPGFLHGGVVSAIIDETMAYAGVFRFEALPLTRKLTISFRRGVDSEKEFLCRSVITQTGEGVFSATGTLSLPGRGNFVLAEADFVLPTREQAARLMPGEHGPWLQFFRK